LKKSSKKYIKKIGVLGGTFDPPHIGHLYISKIAIKKLKLDKVIWVITKQNPLKQKPFLSVNLRLKLSKDMIIKHKKINIKFIDNLIKSNNTFDVLNHLKKNNRNIRLFFLIGSDNLINFHTWSKWRKIPKLAKIIVFARPNYTIKALKSTAAKKLDRNDWIYINSKKINISSSLIRIV